MSRLTRLQSQQDRITARIAEIEAQYPTILALKSGSHGAHSYAQQDFAPVADHYLRLLTLSEELAQQIDALTNVESATSVADFQPVSGRRVPHGYSCR